MAVIKHCHKYSSTTHEIYASGLLRLDKNCRINADNINIRARNNFITDSDEIILLHNRSISTIIEAFLDKLSTLNLTTIPSSQESILIRDDMNDNNRLAKEADNLFEKTKYNETLNEMNFNDYVHSVG